MNSNLHLVTGYAGEEHVTSSDEGSLNAALMGEGQFVLERGNQFAASIISNNKVRVADGDILMQGRHIRLKENTYVELNFDNGTQGYKRNDLIVVRYTKDSITDKEEANLVVIKGTPSETTPADPEYVSGDIINEHTLQNDMPLYRVSFDGLNIQPLTGVFKVIPTIETKTEKMEIKISEKFSRLEEEIDEKLADAGKPVVSNIDDMLLIEEYGKYTADAKTVGEELNKLNNDLTALTDSGAIKGLDAREDGVYITYIPSTGADAVTKKLGNEIDISKAKVDAVKGGSYATGTSVSKSMALSKGKYLIVASGYWTSNGSTGGGNAVNFAVNGGTITERTTYACLVDIPNSGVVTVSTAGNYYLYLFFVVFPL